MIQLSRVLSFTAILLLALVSPGHAAMSDWAVSEGGRMRLVALSQPRNERVVALLQIEPKPGWKTYWRNPGDAGMPPELDASGSTNLELDGIRFPTPEIGSDEAGRFIGYHTPASLVLDFRQIIPGAPSTIRIKALVGICEKICLPFMADFEVALAPGQPEGEEFMLAQLAEAELPDGPKDDFKVTSFKQAADGTSLEAEIILPNSGEPEVAASEAGVGLGAVTVRMTEARKALVTVKTTQGKAAAADPRLVLLVKSGGRAMEAVLALQQAPL